MLAFLHLPKTPLDVPLNILAYTIFTSASSLLSLNKIFAIKKKNIHKIPHYFFYLFRLI